MLFLLSRCIETILGFELFCFVHWAFFVCTIKQKIAKLKWVFKVHLFLKQCLHDLQFMKTRPFLPNLSMLAPAFIHWKILLQKRMDFNPYTSFVTEIFCQDTVFLNIYMSKQNNKNSSTLISTCMEYHICESFYEGFYEPRSWSWYRHARAVGRSLKIREGGIIYS